MGSYEIEQPVCAIVTLPLPLIGYVSEAVCAVAAIVSVYEPDSDAFQIPPTFAHSGFTGGATVRFACAELPSYEAVIVTDWLELTVPAEMVNVAEVAPAGTVTVAGTDASLEPEASATTAPPEGAAAESTTFPVTVPPLATELADRVRL
jgi:hypothetical protein